jgi:hypothetical protein
MLCLEVVVERLIVMSTIADVEHLCIVFVLDLCSEIQINMRSKSAIFPSSEIHHDPQFTIAIRIDDESTDIFLISSKSRDNPCSIIIAEIVAGEIEESLHFSIFDRVLFIGDDCF